MDQVGTDGFNDLTVPVRHRRTESASEYDWCCAYDGRGPCRSCSGPGRAGRSWPPGQRRMGIDQGHGYPGRPPLLRGADAFDQRLGSLPDGGRTPRAAPRRPPPRRRALRDGDRPPEPGRGPGRRGPPDGAGSHRRRHEQLRRARHRDRPPLGARRGRRVGQVPGGPARHGVRPGAAGRPRHGGGPLRFAVARPGRPAPLHGADRSVALHPADACALRCTRRSCSTRRAGRCPIDRHRANREALDAGTGRLGVPPLPPRVAADADHPDLPLPRSPVLVVSDLLRAGEAAGLRALSGQVDHRGDVPGRLHRAITPTVLTAAVGAIESALDVMGIPVPLSPS